MNTRFLMFSSALLLGAVGIAASFLPQEILTGLGIAPTGALPLLVQILGALLLGFAMLNWLAKDTVIGGVYGRPVTVANLAHFAIGALALLKGLVGGATPTLWVASILYTGFAVSFGLVLLTHPSGKSGAPGG
jgi:hypothetical protein